MNFRELESNFKKNVFRNEDDIKIHFLNCLIFFYNSKMNKICISKLSVTK